ncbi:MAG TPA: methyltransferase domain-containing protein, partial [Myxococcota bacterium]
MTYLLAGQAFELERLRLQARVFEPAGERLLAGIARTPGGARALDVGCGAMGWLRILDAWVGEQGTVVGSDIDDKMLDAARAFVDENKLSHVVLSKDDLFASALPASSFDLVHARFQIAPLGRGPEQVRAFVRLTKPGGLIVLEEPDTRSWHVSPRAPAVDELIALILRAFRVGGGDFDAGRALPNLLADAGLTAEVYEQVVTL